MIYATHHRYRPLRPSGRLARLIGGAALAGFLISTAAVAVPPPAAPKAAAPVAPVTKPAVHGMRVPNAVKQAAAAPPEAVLKAAINPEVALLSYPDPREQASARGFIEQDAKVPGGTPSPQYQNGFGAALSTALLPLFKNPDARVRLNAAIVLAKVSLQFNDTTSLAPAATVALNDVSEGVVLWGLKACRGIVPRSIELPQGRPNPLFDAMFRATRAYPASDAIVEEAAYALPGNALVTGTPQAPAPPARVQNAIPYVLTMLEDRIELYRAVQVAPGQVPVVPPAPATDNYAIFFLSGAGYAAAAPADKKRIVRDLLDLGKELARITPNMPPQAVGGPVPNRADTGAVLGKGVGGALQVIAGREGKSGSATAAAPVARLNGNSAPGAIDKAILDVETALTTDLLLGAERPPRPATPPAPAVAPAAPATPTPAKPVAAVPK